MISAIRFFLVTSIFLSISSLRRYLPASCRLVLRHCSTSFLDQKPLILQKHSWNDFHFTSHIFFRYGSPHEQFHHDPFRDGILGTCKLCGAQSEVELRVIGHPSIIYQPFEWISSNSECPKDRKVEETLYGPEKLTFSSYLVNLQNISDFHHRISEYFNAEKWYGLQPRIFLNETYYEGYRPDPTEFFDPTEFLNKIMQDDAHGIRSAWESAQWVNRCCDSYGRKCFERLDVEGVCYGLDEIE